MNQDHQKALRVLCRICGQRCLKQPKAKDNHGIEKHHHHTNLLQKFMVNVMDDDAAIHPEYICLCCLAECWSPRPSARPVIDWTPHGDGTDCTACQLELANRKGGRRPKPAKVGAKRRREGEQKKAQTEAVDAACTTILEATASGLEDPTKQMQQVATCIVKSLLRSSDTDTIELPTGGPKLVMQKVVIPKVSSKVASKRTIRARNKALEHTIHQLSSPTGDDEEAAVFQLAAMLKGKSQAELQQLMQAEGLHKIKIPPGHELAMKAKFGWGWDEMRKLKRWLRAYNIAMAWEGKTRQCKEDILQGANLQREMLPFLFKEEEGTVTKLAPMVSIPDLRGHIMKTLDELDRLNMLTWEDGIPNDEVWVKIGGDAGGGSTKFYFQVLNVAKPNSKFNSTVFISYAADESLANLHIALDRYRDQINALLTDRWSGKKIIPWLCADYFLTCKLLGLQGASATFPCVFCHSRKGDLQKSSPESRSLDSIRDNYRKVKEDDFSSASKRLHKSVDHEPFFDIPLEQVCIPGLHVSMGLWNKFYNLLVEDVGRLGDVIADKLAEESQDSQEEVDRFKSYIKQLKKIQEQIDQKNTKAAELREEMVDLEYQLISQSLNSPIEPTNEQMEYIQSLHDQALKMEEEATKLRQDHKLEVSANPLLHSMDESLKQFKVRRQSWHSQTFVGNHVNKCLKRENYTKLLDDLVRAATDLYSSDEILDMAESIKVKYSMLFDHFARCHQMYSRGGPLMQDEINKLESDISNLVEHYKLKFPNSSFTPKFHLLSMHTVAFVKRTGMGLGKMGEQGGEQLHCEFNAIGRKMQGCKNTKRCDPALQHLAAVMEEHLIKVNPTNRQLMEE